MSETSPRPPQGKLSYEQPATQNWPQPESGAINQLATNDSAPFRRGLFHARAGRIGGMQSERTIAEFRECLCGLRQPLREPSRFRRLLDRLLGQGPAGRTILIANYTRMIGVIDAMTSNGRTNPESLDATRIKRIARGAGVRPAWVKYTLNFFAYWRAGHPPFNNT